MRGNYDIYYYTGKDIDTLKYGQECIVDHRYDKIKDVNVIEVVSSMDFSPIVKLETQIKFNGKLQLKAFKDLQHFVDEDEWFIIDRYNRLSKLLED